MIKDIKRLVHEFLEFRDCNRSKKLNLLHEGEVQKVHMKSIIEFANQLIALNKEACYSDREHPIFRMVKILGSKINYQYAYNLFINGKRLPFLIPFNFFCDLSSLGIDFNDFVIKPSKQVCMDLNKDLLLPGPWSREKLQQSLNDIGYGKVYGSWAFKPDNHAVSLWLPMGIGWVEAGNHSIMTGMSMGEGTIVPKYIVDISILYKLLECDGQYYFNRNTGKKVSSVRCFEIAAIFEIGRLMSKNDISYKNILSREELK